MKNVWDACKRARIEVPLEVQAFFNDEPPDPKGVRISLADCTTQWKAPEAEGYEVDLTQVPSNVKFIRFYRSW
jgi:hypothetical protein